MNFESPPAALLLRRSEPEPRAVLEDWLSERGRRIQECLPLIGYGYGDGGGDGVDGGDGDDGGYGDGGYGDGGYGKPNLKASSESDMRPGLKIISTPSGYYPYVLVGWLRRVEGDEWEVVGARVIKRFGQSQALASLATKGPATDTQLLDAATEPEPIHRLQITRAIACDAKSWAKEVPRPKGWEE